MRVYSAVSYTHLDVYKRQVQEHADANERLARSKVTDNARIILALTAIGKDVTKDVYKRQSPHRPPHRRCPRP